MTMANSAVKLGEGQRVFCLVFRWNLQSVWLKWPMILASKDDAITAHRIHCNRKSILFALNYEDLNDHDSIRKDIAFQTTTGCDGDPASTPTLCRFENRIILSHFGPSVTYRLNNSSHLKTSSVMSFHGNGTWKRPIHFWACRTWFQPGPLLSSSLRACLKIA
jgi:hypothetical protein